MVEICIAPDGSVVGPSKREILNSQGRCYACTMKHFPYCEYHITLCRTCGCGKEWHPLDGPCRVGPETEFTLHDCYCKGYIPKDNLEYLESIVDKNLE